MLDRKIKLLMTGGGAPGAYGILKSIFKEVNIHVTAADMRQDCIGKILAHSFVQIPKATDPQFIETLLGYCKENKIDILFPLVTKELELFSYHREQFEAIGTKIIVAEYNLLKEVNNKGDLYKALAKNNIPVPSFEITKDLVEFEKAAKKLGYPNNRICLKPCNSNGMRGFRILDKNQDTFNLWLNEKPSSAHTSWEEIAKIISNEDCPPILVSEYLPGDEYTIDVLVSNGETKYIIPRLRKKMIGGISVEGTITKNEKIIEYCKKIISIFPLEGLFGIQVKYSEKNKPLLLEINPRVQGTTVACSGAGINLPLMAVYNTLGILKDTELPSVKWETRFIRHWEEKYL
jgi:carbamoyl-phosphate synthase large subunit